ncbi:hypothetical protein L596_014438 [Steinernema carpocapsae]|uniref:Major facilitator superfamily (MFS) profile domain-containing protein n=1 Tax=Steinernema carpocapsae TaxID=34508 RepID=A0A4U5NCV0_STECR|nr:hypothetical protein L596_014438 [Steinernema carpocapsae]
MFTIKPCSNVFFAVLFLGVLVGIFPLTAFLQSYGPHQTVIIIGTCSTIFTGTMPFWASLGFPYLVTLRFLQGVGIANVFPIIGSIMTRWAALSESGLFISLLTGYIQLSIIISAPISGFCGLNYGWPSIYYVHSVLASVITLIWTLFFRNNPFKHPFVGEKEIRKISTGKAPITSVKAALKVPYKQIFTSVPMIVVWIAVMGNFLVTQFSITFYNMYLVWVLKLDVETAGFLATLPLVAQLVLKFVTGLLSDRITFLSERNKCRFFNSLAFYGAAFFFVVVAFVHPEDKILCAILTMIPQAMIGFNPGGFNKSSVLVARQFSPAVLTVTQAVLCSTLFAGSFIVPSLTPNNTFAEYRNVFLLYAVVLVVTNTIFIIFCRAEAAEWTKEMKEVQSEGDKVGVAA